MFGTRDTSTEQGGALQGRLARVFVVPKPGYGGGPACSPAERARNAPARLSPWRDDRQRLNRLSFLKLVLLLLFNHALPPLALQAWRLAPAWTHHPPRMQAAPGPPPDDARAGRLHARRYTLYRSAATNSQPARPPAVWLCEIDRWRKTFWGTLLAAWRGWQCMVAAQAGAECCTSASRTGAVARREVSRGGSGAEEAGSEARV